MIHATSQVEKYLNTLISACQHVLNPIYESVVIKKARVRKHS